MPSPAGSEGLDHVQQLASLEERHRSLSFEDARRGVFTDETHGWRSFVEKYSRFVYTVALRLLPGPDDRKQDQAQEIYCWVFSHLQQNDYKVLREFQARCRFTTYLFRMVQTARSTVLRREGREAERMDFVDFSDEANRGIEAAAEREGAQEALPNLSPERLRGEITRVLEDLSPRDRLLVKLRFQKGLKLRELVTTLRYRDTNDAAYALKKALKHFEPLAALEGGDWTEEEMRFVLDVLDQELFQ